MTNPVDLESLYEQAQAALKANEYTRASALLQQIVAVDATYKETSRLLANLVAQQRRRWYNDSRLYATLGVVVLIALGVLIASALPALLPVRATETPTMIALAPTATATRVDPTATATALPTLTPAPNVTPTRAPTGVPLVWKRISLGQEFPRDTIMAIAVDLRDTDVMYAGGAYSGIFKSLDGGESWYPSHLGLERAAVNTLAIDPQDPRILYVGTSGGGVYKTTDGGEHWRAINQGMSISTSEWLSAVIIDPKDSRHLYYASDSRGPYESKDAGETWQRVKQSSCPDVKAYAFVMHPQDPKTLFWAEGQGSSTCQPALYKSTDGGVNWAMTNLQDGRVASQTRALAIDGKDGNILFAYKSPPGRIFKSADGGMNWTQLSHGICGFLAVHPDNPDWVYCGDESSGALDQSTDGGQNWRRSDLGTSVLRAMTFFPQPSTNMLLGGQGVFLSTDSGNSWKSMSKGLGSVLMQLVLDPKQSGVLYAHETSCSDSKASHALYRSADQGRTWQFATDQRCAFAFDADGTTLYGVTSSTGEVARSQDGGRAWTKTSAMDGPSSLTAHPYQKGMLFLFGGSSPSSYFRFSTDGGNTWQNASGISPSGNDYKLYFDHDQGQVVYTIGLNDPHHRSTDGGRSWTACGATNARFAKDSDSRAVVDPRNSNRIMVATLNGGVLLSEDGCKSWRLMPTRSGAASFNTIALDLRNPDRVYAGTDNGAYVSFDGGKSWNGINDGLLGALVIYSIVVDPRDSSVYAATPYGIFKLEAR